MSRDELRRKTGDAARELGRRLSAAGALAVALITLVCDGPLWLACALGSAALVALRFATRLGASALSSALRNDGRDSAEKDREKAA